MSDDRARANAEIEQLNIDLAGSKLECVNLERQLGIQTEEMDELRAEVERLKRFVRECIVCVGFDGHTLGCECGAMQCEKRKQALMEAK